MKSGKVKLTKKEKTSKKHKVKGQVKEKGKGHVKGQRKVRVGVRSPSPKIKELIDSMVELEEVHAHRKIYELLNDINPDVELNNMEKIEFIEAMLDIPELEHLFSYRFNTFNNILDFNQKINLQLLKIKFDPFLECQESQFLSSCINYYNLAIENEVIYLYFYNILDLLLDLEKYIIIDGLDSELFRDYEALVVKVIGKREASKRELESKLYLAPIVSFTTLYYATQTNSELIINHIIHKLISNIGNDLITIGNLVFLPSLSDFDRYIGNFVSLTRTFSIFDLIHLVDYECIPLDLRMELIQVMVDKIRVNPEKVMIQLDFEDRPLTLNDELGKKIILHKLLGESISTTTSIELFHIIISRLELSTCLSSLKHLIEYEIPEESFINRENQGPRTLLDIYKFLLSEKKKSKKSYLEKARHNNKSNNDSAGKKESPGVISLTHVNKLREGILYTFQKLNQERLPTKLYVLDGDEIPIRIIIRNYDPTNEYDKHFEDVFMEVVSTNPDIQIQHLAEINIILFLENEEYNIIIPLITGRKDRNFHIHQRQLFRLASLLNQQTLAESAENNIFGLFQGDPGAGGGAAPIAHNDNTEEESITDNTEYSNSYTLVKKGPSRNVKQTKTYFGKPGRYNRLSTSELESNNSKKSNQQGGQKKTKKKHSNLASTMSNKITLSYVNKISFRQKMLGLTLLKVKEYMKAKNIKIKDSVLFKLIKEQRKLVR